MGPMVHGSATRLAGLLARRALGGVLLGGLVLVASGCLLDSGPTASPSESSTPAASAAASSAVAVTPSPAASIGPAASGGVLAPGTYAKVTVDGLRVRISAKPDGTAVGALFFGDVVRIRSEAGAAGGYTWYQVETVQTANDQPLLGYIAGAKDGQSYLEALPGPPPPTPSHTPTPSPGASAAASA